MGDIGLRNETRHVHDPSSGWPVRVEAKRSSRRTGRTRTDVTVIEAK